jgi:hypothetical protein
MGDAGMSMGDAGACPGMVLHADGISVSGTITFNADLTYTDTLMTTTTVTDSLPAACLMQGPITFTCSQVQAYFNAGRDAGSQATCTSNASGGCDCTVMQSSSSTAMGTYATSGDSVTLTPTSGGSGPNTNTYCVQGNKLYVYSGGTIEIEATQ